MTSGMTSGMTSAMTSELQGKVAFITGAASGLGAPVEQCLARMGRVDILVNNGGTDVTPPIASACHAGKWGLLGLSHALHAELRPHAIRVTAVIAGGMRTPFLLDRFPDIDAASLQAPASVAQAIRQVLLLPRATVVPELTVLPMRESSWP